MLFQCWNVDIHDAHHEISRLWLLLDVSPSRPPHPAAATWQSKVSTFGSWFNTCSGHDKTKQNLQLILAASQQDVKTHLRINAIVTDHEKCRKNALLVYQPYRILSGTGSVLVHQPYGILSGTGSVLGYQPYGILSDTGSVLVYQPYGILSGIGSVLVYQPYGILSGTGSVLVYQPYGILSDTGRVLVYQPYGIHSDTGSVLIYHSYGILSDICRVQQSRMVFHQEVAHPKACVLSFFLSGECHVLYMEK